MTLDLIIRFSNSEPDQSISVQQPQYISGLSVRQRLRERLSEDAGKCRLRLIHAGKVIADRDALSKSLGNVLSPPTRDHAPKSDKARGKQPVRETEPVRRVYIHCSIGDTLSAAELQDERDAAEEADLALLSGDSSESATNHGKNEAQPGTTTSAAPQGFDRLLSAGFTPAEVVTLRTQFMAIQAHTHTPETMPTGAALLALEERWLEQPSANAGANGGSDDPADDGFDDMLVGSLVGFFWPIGVMCFLMREEGVWSRRRQFMVLLGFFINLMFGFLRMLR